VSTGRGVRDAGTALCLQRRGPVGAGAYDERMTPTPSQIQYPRSRMEALTDGIYAVAMTLLVLDIRLPEDFRPRSGDELLQGLLGLWPKLLPYGLSFLVLGLRWLAEVQVRVRGDSLGGGAFVRWWLLHLLLVTCVPFTTIVVGRYASFAPAVWLYAGNTALMAIASWRLLRLTPAVEHDHHLLQREVALLVLLASSLLSIGCSFVSPGNAMYAFLLNLATPTLARRRTASRPTPPP
jgi:uncharacterized membrane protein